MVSQQVLSAGATDALRSNAARTFSVADLNGDGFADIVSPYWTAPDGSAGVAVFLSQPSGTYTIPAKAFAYASAVSGFGARVSIEDIDGDGKLDVVAVAGTDTGGVLLSTLKGNGSGGFVPGSSSVATQANAAPFVIADFTGDGRKSILTADGLYFADAGNGSFAAPVQRLSGTTFPIPSNTLAVGDFNGDGKLDVAVLGGLSNVTGRFVSVFLGRGDGTFSAGPIYSTVLRASELAVTDIDGDGIADLWVGKADSGAYSAGRGTVTLMHFMLGKGDGTFTGAPVIESRGSAGSPSFAVADFNGDGKPDLVSLPRAVSGFQTNPSQLLFSPGSASGSLGAPVVAANVSFTPSMLTRGDFNGDGKIDVVVAGIKLAVFSGQGNGSFSAEQAYALPATGGNLVNLAVGDFNGDGRADVVVLMGAQSAASGGAFVYFANADGTLKAPVQIDSATNLGSVAVGDINGDGRADLVVSGLDPQFYSSPNKLRGARVYRGNADGSFSAPLLLAPPAGILYGPIAIGDMNKDGKPDLVLAGATASLDPQVSVLPGNGDGTFGAASVFPLLGGQVITAVIVADFSFDGNPDLMVLRDSDTTEVLHGDGTGKIAAETALAIAGSATYGVAADLNGDTVPDAVVAVGSSGIVPLLRTRQAIVAAAVTPIPTAPYTVSASSASGSVASGESVQTTLNFTFPSGFAETVGLACTGLPANATCSYAPASVVPAGGVGTTVLTIQTGRQAAAIAMLEPGGGPGDPPWLRSAALAALVAMGSITLLGTQGRIAVGTRARRGLRYGTVAAMGLVAGCGGSDGSNSAGQTGATQFVTPSGVYNIVVTASSPSGSQSLPYVLTVK